MCRSYSTFVFGILSCLIVGCATPLALRRQTVHQADTVADLHQQQVLDNLAKFVADPYAIPSFAFAQSGSTEVADQADTGLDIGWIRSGFDAIGLSFGAQRNQTATWTTMPVTDPRKLELMRCAYQRAVTQCTGVPESICCPDCRKRFNEFYTGRPYATKTVLDDSNKPVTVYQCDGDGRLSNLVPSPCEDGQVCARCGVDKSAIAGCHDPHDVLGVESMPAPPAGDPTNTCYCNNLASPGEAEVNSECLNSSGCWFCCGWKKCVPDGCGYVGHYCGTYVWVPPGPGRDELAKLTLAVLDYAVHEDRRLPTKEVVAFVDRNGIPTTEDQASYVVTATIGSADRNASVLWSERQPERLAGLLKLRKELNTELNEFSKSLKTMDAAKQTMAREQFSAKAAELSDLNSEIEAIQSLPVSPPSPMPQQLSPTPNAGLLLLQQQLNTVQ
jgi:hypothetical protein